MIIMNLSTSMAFIASVTLFARPSVATSPRPEELAEARHWAAARFEANPAAPESRLFSTTPPFSFVYGGRPSIEWLKDARLTRGTRNLEPARSNAGGTDRPPKEHTLTWTGSGAGLQVRCVAI